MLSFPRAGKHTTQAPRASMRAFGDLRLTGLPGTIDRNKGIQIASPRTPRPPESARRAEDSGATEPSFRRPLLSARARLETHLPRNMSRASEDIIELREAAGGRPDHPAIRQNDGLRGIQTQNTGKGYLKPSVNETQWGIDVYAQEVSNPSNPMNDRALSRMIFAHDYRRNRFHHRTQVLSEIEGYDLATRSGPHKTPAAERAFRLERELRNNRLSDAQRAVLSYELDHVKRESLQDKNQCDYAKSRSIVRITGGRDETTECDDVVATLLELQKGRKLDQERLEQEIAAEKEEEYQKQEIAKKVVLALSRDQVSHQVTAKLRSSAARAKTILEDSQINNGDACAGKSATNKDNKTNVGGGDIQQAAVHEIGHSSGGGAKLRETGNGAKSSTVTLSGGNEQNAIPKVELTNLQYEMYDKCLFRQFEEKERSRLEAVEREKEEIERLWKLKEARKDDMLADELRHERALERQVERERQVDLKTVPESKLPCSLADVRQRNDMMRAILRDFVGARGDYADKPVEEWDDDRVRRILPDGRTMTVPLEEVFSGAKEARSGVSHSYRYFVRLVGVAIDSKGRMIAADSENHCIRRFEKDGSDTIVAGSGDSQLGGVADGAAEKALFLCPTGIAVDRNDNIYVADFHNNRIRKVSSDGIVSTIAGTGVPGHMDGEGSSAQLDHPESLALDARGNLLVADWGNHRIRKICLRSSSPVQQRSSMKREKSSALTKKLFGNSTKNLMGKGSTNSLSQKRLLQEDAQAAKDNEEQSMSSTAPSLPPQEKWMVTTVAGSGDKGFKDATGEAARFNFPHGICVADDGVTVMVVDSCFQGAQKPAEDLEAQRIRAEWEKKQKEEEQIQADILECTGALRDSDTLAMKRLRVRFDPTTLDRIWRWGWHEARDIDKLMEQKAVSMLKSGMTDFCDIQQRVAAARRVEVSKRFYFHRILDMLQAKEKKYDEDKKTEDTTASLTMANEFDEAIMAASAEKVDQKLLKSGPGELCLFRLELTKRFNSVFDAWIFFDMDGDGSISQKEFVSLCRTLRLPKGILPEDVFAEMQGNNMARGITALSRLNKEMMPLDFVRVLRWHTIPSTDLAIMTSLDNARDKRKEIHKMCTLRTVRLYQDQDRAVAEAAFAAAARHHGPSKIKDPIRVSVGTRLAQNPRSALYPHYEPLKTAEVKAPEPLVLVQRVVEKVYELPAEINETNWQVAIVLDHRRQKGLDKMGTYDITHERVSKMLSEKYVKRGRVWRLKDAADANDPKNWDQWLMVLTRKGVLLFEPENGELLTENPAKASRIVMKYDMHTIIKHQEFELNVMGGYGVEMWFRVKNNGRRVTQYLYLAFGEIDEQCRFIDKEGLHDDWWKALRTFSWRADEFNEEHLGAKWSSEEQVVFDEIQSCIRAKFEERLIRKVQRWFRLRRKQRSDAKQAMLEAIESSGELHRMAYLMKNHGPIGDQGGWLQPEQNFSFSRGLCKAEPPASTSLQSARRDLYLQLVTPSKLQPATSTGPSTIVHESRQQSSLAEAAGEARLPHGKDAQTVLSRQFPSRRETPFHKHLQALEDEAEQRPHSKAFSKELVTVAPCVQLRPYGLPVQFSAWHKGPIETPIQEELVDNANVTTQPPPATFIFDKWQKDEWRVVRKKVKTSGDFDGLLHVTVHKIDEFRDTVGVMDRTDPFVVLQLGSEKQKTSYKENPAADDSESLKAGGKKVIFDELLTFTNKRITDSTLKVQVYDKDEGKIHDRTDRFLWDDILGECDVNLNLLNLREDAESEEPVAFECMHKGKAAGKVYLRFSRKAVCDQHSE